jgi:hypothetical protein
MMKETLSLCDPFEGETTMQTQTTPSRNPIARSFGAGINQPQIIPNKRRDRRVKHRNRWREDNACGAE